jgi:hypothetical protein
MNVRLNAPLKKIWTINCVSLKVFGGKSVQVAVQKGGTYIRRDTAMAMLMLRILVFTILLLTGCDNGQVKENPAPQVQQIESPLQNTVEGMAKAKALDLEQARLTARGF